MINLKMHKKLVFLVDLSLSCLSVVKSSKFCNQIGGEEDLKSDRNELVLSVVQVKCSTYEGSKL